MGKKAPGRSHREGISVMELHELFPDNATAEKWFEAQRWPDGVYCPDCGSVNCAVVKSRKPMPYRCRDCRAHFSVRKGTAMETSNLGLQKWAFAFYLMTTGIKGTASMKVARDLGITQKTAWFLMQRIREGFMAGLDRPFPGPVEMDETYIGGKEGNKHSKKRHRKWSHSEGKSIVAGVRDRPSKQISAAVIDQASRDTLQGFVLDRTEETATVYTDEGRPYQSLGAKRTHESVRHKAGEYVRGDVTTNGIEGFWSLFKRSYHGTFHKISHKHLDRYVAEFSGRQNLRDLNTIDMMRVLFRGTIGKRLRYRDLIADNGLPSGARS